MKRTPRSRTLIIDDPMDGSGVPMADGSDDAMDIGPTPKFECMFINMGQGECTLIKCPDGRIGMIDCGSSAYFNSDEPGSDRTKINKKNKIKKAMTDQISRWSGDYIYWSEDGLLPYNNKDCLDFLVLTHCDHDHYNWVKQVFNRIRIKKVYFSDGPNSIGPQSFCGRDPDQYEIIGDNPNHDITFKSMFLYKIDKRKPATDFFKSACQTEEVIEVVINEHEQCTYTYNLGRTEGDPPIIGSRDSQYGTRFPIDVNEQLPNGELVIAEEGVENGWKVSIVAGNVLKERGPSRKRKAAQENKPNKNLGRIEEDESEDVDKYYEDPAPDKPKVYVPYYDSKTRNTASLCTQFSYLNPANVQETILLMGDSTNLTFEYLKTKAWTNCKFSNIPHHGSSTDCNDIYGETRDVLDENNVWQPPPNGSLEFIVNILKPQSAIVSTRPEGVVYKIGKHRALKKYFDTATDLGDQHSIDVWETVDPNGGENSVKKIKESWDDAPYPYTEGQTKRGEPNGWFTLNDYNTMLIPEGGLPYMLSPDIGAVLRRINISKNVKLPSMNSDPSPESEFKFVKREFLVKKFAPQLTTE